VGDTLETAAKPIKAVGEIVKPYVPNIGESEVVQKINKKVSETEEALLENTNAYQYGGYKDKEARERSKLRSKTTEEPVPEVEAEKDQVVEENPEYPPLITPSNKTLVRVHPW
jgi:hypothetical protein